MSKVQVIEPTNPILPYKSEKLRVCAYARVSSDSEDQMNSFIAQVTHYTDYIASKTDWQFVDVYADEGITGTRTDKRDEFNRMLKDCRKGKIDLILVKTVSRFARNVQDCIATVRELKSLGVNVDFEENGLRTADMHDELMISAFGSIAQEESLSISSNMRWSYQRRMNSGKFITNKAPYGYELLDNMLIPNMEELKIVKRIFDSYLDGKSMQLIAEELMKDAVIGKNGSTKWNMRGISYILTNEKYIGNARLQKWYSSETLPFRMRRNKGEKDQYYITASHEPIISEENFKKTQELITFKEVKISPCLSKSERTSLPPISCGICGKSFRHKEVRTKNYKVCRGHYENKAICGIKQIREEAFMETFRRMYNKLRVNIDYVLSPALREMINLKEKLAMHDGKVANINKEIAETMRQSQILNSLRAKGYMDSAIFIQKNNELLAIIDHLKKERSQLLEKGDFDKVISDLKLLIEIITDGPTYLENYDSCLAESIVEKITVLSQNNLEFRLLGGLEFIEKLPLEVEYERQ